jgi:class 3 adenylate cyclase
MIERDWGGTPDITDLAPSRASDRAFADWFGRLCRLSASPGAAVRLAKLNTQIDMRAVLPVIGAPTLVMNRKGDRDAKVEEARYIASRIPNARLIELEGGDHLPWSEGVEDITGEVEEFITGARAIASEQVLATILCTDIVGSTARRAAMGDAAWQELLDRHNSTVRSIIRQRQGIEINTTGDGFLASFASPARALHAALETHSAMEVLGLPVRAGVHTGECQRRGAHVSGVAIDIAVRIAALAGPGEVTASRTVRDLTIGADLDFSSRGLHALKGAPDTWEVFTVSPRTVKSSTPAP